MHVDNEDGMRAIDSTAAVSVDSLDTSSVPFCAVRGDMAPTFQAHAYHRGGHIKIDSTKFIGKWLILFFYPSDFTFV